MTWNYTKLRFSRALCSTSNIDEFSFVFSFNCENAFQKESTTVLNNGFGPVVAITDGIHPDYDSIFTF